MYPYQRTPSWGIPNNKPYKYHGYTYVRGVLYTQLSNLSRASSLTASFGGSGFSASPSSPDMKSTDWKWQPNQLDTTAATMQLSTKKVYKKIWEVSKWPGSSWSGNLSLLFWRGLSAREVAQMFRLLKVDHAKKIHVTYAKSVSLYQ